MLQQVKFGIFPGRVPAIVLQDETVAWAAAVVAGGGTVSDGRKLIVNALIAGLKTDGIWAKLDCLWLFAAENEISALTDLVTNLDATKNGTPTFTTDRGYTTSAGPNQIDTPYNPSTFGGNFTQNSGCIFGWSNTSGTSGTGPMCGNASDKISIYVNQDISGSAFGNVNDISYTGVNVANGLGFYHANRSGASAVQLYKNGSSIITGTPASLAVANEIIGVSESTAVWAGQSCALGLGGSLDGTEANNLYSRMRTYMTAVGVP